MKLNKIYKPHQKQNSESARNLFKKEIKPVVLNELRVFFLRSTPQFTPQLEN